MTKSISCNKLHGFFTDPYVRVTLYSGGRKLKRKKTTTKRIGPGPVPGPGPGPGPCPEWNEALVFNLTKDIIETVQTEVALFSENLLGTDEPVGRVLFASNTSGLEHIHWLNALSGRSSSSTWFRLIPMDK